MELRRFKDILGVKSNEDTLLAFHGRNLEVAEISNDAWAALSPIELTSSQIPRRTLDNSEPQITLRNWEEEINPNARTNKIDTHVRFLTLNVTQICNLHCNYCAAGGDGTFGDAVAKISIEKTLPQIQFFLNRLPSQLGFNISFLGGEPLLYPEAIELIAKYISEHAPQRRVNYNIITNGTLLTEKNVELLARIGATITISLDGPPEINDQMRPTKNGSSSTALVVQGLERLLARKSEFSHIMIHGVFDHNNIALLKAYEFYSQFNVDSYDFSFSISENDLNASQEFMRQLSLVAAQAFEKGGESALRKIRAFEQHFQSLDSQTRTENYCGAGKSFLMIDARNQISTCPWDVNLKNEQVGQGIELNQKSLEAYQKPLIDLNNCNNCWARFLCGGGCLAAHKHGSGYKNIKNTQFCERTRYLVALALVYYQKCRAAS